MTEGSVDLTIEAAQLGDSETRISRPAKPFGGKALMRLISAMDRRGLHNQADAAINVMVTEEAREAVAEARAQFSAAAPALVGNAPAPRARTREAPQRSREREASEDGEAASVAEMYHEAASAAGPQPTGVPTPTGPQWRSIGPWTIPNGQTYGASRVNVSGRVAAIAIHPSNPARVLCGAAHGGVWESFDRGASWAPRTDYARTLTVGALAYDPSRPDTVYCGTGEGNWWSWLGAGILRSSDGGTTWSTLCTAPFVGQGFFDLEVSPSDGNRLVAATTGGLYVSTDGGTTWSRRRSALTWSIAIAPGPVATAEMLAGCSDGVYRSGDGGTTWTAVTIAGTPASFTRLAVAIARSNPSVAYMWGASGATAYAQRRAAGAWSAMPLPAGLRTNQAWYDWYLAAAPDRDNQIFTGAIESYRADLSGSTWTWTNLSNKGASGDSIHPDQHAIAFEPGNPNTIYIGCDGGLFRSANRGINWTSCNNGLVISEIEYLSQDFGSSRYLLAGTQDNGTQQWTGAPAWTHVADGDGGDCGVNRTTPTTVFHTYFGMSPERSTTSGGFGSWSGIAPPVPAGEGSAFYPPFECSASGGSTIGIGGDAVYVSRNNGTNWTRLAYPSAARSSAMYISNPDTVHVGTADGRIFRTTWSGTAWSALSALTQPRLSATVSDIKVDPSNAQIVWATYSTMDSATSSGRVFRSGDGGSSWQNRTAGLPGLPMNTIEIDNQNGNRVWVAADLGVYKSLNAGAIWTDFAATLPNCFIGDLLFHPHARVLRAGTRNRGVWEIPVDGWMTTPQCGVQWTGTLNANETKRWFTFNWPATWHMIWTVMPITPNAAGAQITWSVAVERANAEFVTYWITVQNLTNVAVTFEGRYAILSRY